MRPLLRYRMWILTRHFKTFVLFTSRRIMLKHMNLKYSFKFKEWKINFTIHSLAEWLKLRWGIYCSFYLTQLIVSLQAVDFSFVSVLFHKKTYRITRKMGGWKTYIFLFCAFLCFYVHKTTLALVGCAGFHFLPQPLFEEGCNVLERKKLNRNHY